MVLFLVLRVEMFFAKKKKKAAKHSNHLLWVESFLYKMISLAFVPTLFTSLMLETHNAPGSCTG